MSRQWSSCSCKVRNILVSAAYLVADDGAQVTMDHLLHGTRRELQKMGRPAEEERMVIGQASAQEGLTGNRLKNIEQRQYHITHAQVESLIN